MSIARGNQRALRSFRSLMCFVLRRVFFIKDLKALENGTTRVSIDIKVLTDLKSRFFKSGFAAAREIILQILSSCKS